MRHTPTTHRGRVNNLYDLRPWVVLLNSSVTVDLKYHEQDIPLLEVLDLKNEYD